MSVQRENVGAYVATFFVMVGFGTYGIFVRWANLPGKEQYIVFYRVLISLFILLLAIVVTRRTGQLRLREGYLLLVLTRINHIKLEGVSPCFA